MNEQEKNNQEQNVEMDDMEIAELAKRELDKRNEEIRKLKKELAQAKLLSEPKEEEEPSLTKDDCMKVLFNGNTCNYDFAVAVCNLVDIERDEGNPNPLGKRGDEVYNFFEECIDACNGDKSKFPAVYQAKIGNDDAPVIAKKNKR